MSEDFDIDALLFGTKRCPRCGVEKAANSEQFVRDKSTDDGLTRVCKECRLAASRAAYRANPAAYIERNRRYRERKGGVASVCG